MKVFAKPLFNSKLYRTRKIKNMIVGEVGYTVPWSFDPDTNEIDDDITIDEFPHGTVQLMVKRTHYGYEVDLLDHDYQWD